MILRDVLMLPLPLLALYGVGRATRRIVPLTFWGRAADLAYTVGFGLGAVSLLLFGFALIGLLTPLVGWGLLLAGTALAALHWRDLLDDAQAAFQMLRNAVGESSWWVRGLLLIALVFTLTNLLANLAPPVEGDTTHQYLLLPVRWVEAGQYSQPAHIWASTLPGNLMMISAWALLLTGSTSFATLLTGSGMSLLLLIGVYALARLYVRPGPALLAAAALGTMPDFAYLAQSAKVDMGWALFEVLALAAFFRYLDTDDRSWLLLSGLMLGLAAGSKNQTPLSIALLGLWVLGHALIKHDWRRALGAGFMFGIAILATGFPYYLYNALSLGNPFYPVFADPFAEFFGAVPSPRSELGTEVFYPWTVGGYLTNLWNASLGHGPDFYLGFIAGPIFLLSIPVGAALGLLRGERPIWRMVAYAMVFSVGWFFVKQAARHFLPGLMLLSVAVGLVLWRLDRHPNLPRRIVQTAAVAVLAWNLISIWGVLYWSGAWRVAAGVESRSAYLERWHDEVITPDFPDWETLQALNGLGPGARVLSLHATMPLYAEPDLVSGGWGDRLAYDAIDDERTLLAALQEHNIGYIMTWTIDEPGAALFTNEEFLQEHTTLIYDGARAQLYSLKD